MKLDLSIHDQIGGKYAPSISQNMNFLTALAYCISYDTHVGELVLLDLEHPAAFISSSIGLANNKVPNKKLMLTFGSNLGQ